MIKKSIKYEEENEKLILFLEKQAKRIRKLRKKCNGKEDCNGNLTEKKKQIN